MRRPLAASLAAVLAVPALLTAAAPAGTACTVKADLPATVVVDRPYREVPVRLTNTCGADYAAFDIYGPDGWEDILIYDPITTREYWDIYDWITPGAYKTRDGHAYDADYDDVPVAHDSTVVRFGSRAGISATRSGKYVTVTGITRRYNPSTQTFTPWGGAKVTIERRYPDGRWAPIVTLNADRTGKVTRRVYTPRTAYWRAIISPTSAVWGRTSPSIAK